MSDRTHDTPTTQSLDQVGDLPVLGADIVDLIFSHIPPGDSETATRMTEVCRLWYHVGHRHVWREFDSQLRGLVLNVKDQARREYLASLFRVVYLPPGDNSLATDQTTLQTLDLPRLESLHIHLSNLDGIRFDNIQALIGPSLRSFLR
jgi:hypothetical protein